MKQDLIDLLSTKDERVSKAKIRNLLIFELRHILGLSSLV